MGKKHAWLDLAGTELRSAKLEAWENRPESFQEITVQ